MYVTNYDDKNDKITIFCANCDTETVHSFDDQNLAFNEEFGAYNNPSFTCPNCKSLTVVNFNLPEFEEAELEAMALDMPAYDVRARKAIRNAMWKKRPDLKKKNRSAEQKKFAKNNAAEIARQRSRINKGRYGRHEDDFKFKVKESYNGDIVERG